MAINVNWTGNVGAMGQAALLGGVGNLAKEYRARAEAQRAQAAGFAQDRAMQEDRQSYDLKSQQAQLQAKREDRDLQMADDMAKARLQQEGYDTRQLNEFAFKDAFAEDQADRQFNTFTDKQEAEMTRYENGLADVASRRESGELSPEEADALEYQIQGAMAGVKPQARPKPEPKTPSAAEIQAKFEAEVITAEDGTRWTIDKEGKWSQHMPPKPEKDNEVEVAKAQVKERMDVLKMALSIQANGGFNEAGKAMMTLEEAKEQARQMIYGDDDDYQPRAAPNRPTNVIDALRPGTTDQIRSALGSIQGQMKAPPPAPVTPLSIAAPPPEVKAMAGALGVSPQVTQAAQDAVRQAKLNGITDREQLRAIASKVLQSAGAR